MTPFGDRMRALRAAHSINQKDLAAALNVSAAYLSALEHGNRGTPSFSFIQKVIQHFGLIWDDAEEIWELAQISSPRVTIDTQGMPEKATRLANRLAQKIRYLEDSDLDKLLDIVDPEPIIGSITHDPDREDQ